MPYTYLIGWSSHQKYYYGVRYAQGCSSEDLWKTYFTSSRHVTEYRVKYGEPDIIKIRKIFKTKEQAVAWETKFLHKVRAHVNPIFINKTNNKAINNTAEIYNTIVQRRKARGIWHTKEARQNMSIARRKSGHDGGFKKYGNMGQYQITFPDGSTETITHLKSFCRDNNLSVTSMSSLSTGKYPYSKYKGFKCRKLGTVKMVRNHLSNS